MFSFALKHRKRKKALCFAFHPVPFPWGAAWHLKRGRLLLCPRSKYCAKERTGHMLLLPAAVSPSYTSGTSRKYKETTLLLTRVLHGLCPCIPCWWVSEYLFLHVVSPPHSVLPWGITSLSPSPPLSWLNYHSHLWPEAALHLSYHTSLKLYLPTPIGKSYSITLLPEASP